MKRIGIGINRSKSNKPEYVCATPISALGNIQRIKQCGDLTGYCSTVLLCRVRGFNAAVRTIPQFAPTAPCLTGCDLCGAAPVFLLWPHVTSLMPRHSPGSIHTKGPVGRAGDWRRSSLYMFLIVKFEMEPAATVLT